MAFTLLYAAEGAPIGFIWWALPALLRMADLPVAQITGLTAIVVLPWVFKFAWAPLVDTLTGSWWGLRAWIVTAQLLMGVTLLPLIWLDPVEHFERWRLLLVLHAIAAATQDVAIDALAIRSVPLEHRGLLNGCMQAGMLTGRSLFGGGAVLVAAWVGREWMLAVLAASIWIAIAAAWMLDDLPIVEPSRARASAFARHLVHAFSQRTTWLAIGFALLGGAAFEATGQLAGPFLVDRQATPGAIGVFFGVFAVAATLVGGLLGGRLSDRHNRVRTVAAFLIGIAATVGLVAVADLAGASAVTLIVLLTLLYFFIGLFTAASYALFMDVTDPRIGGTQFSTYMAATNGCESWSAAVGGRLAGAGGYPFAMLVMSGVSLAGLVFLRLLRRRQGSWEVRLKPDPKR